MSKTFNAETQKAWICYRAEHQLSQAEAGRELGVSASAINKYELDKPEGDVDKLEALMTDVMKNAPKRRRMEIALFETPISRDLAGCLEQVRKTSDVGVITGEEGWGKSCGAQWYAAKNPTAILLTGLKAFCNARMQRRMLWEQVNTTGWRNKEMQEDPPPSQDRYLIKKFTGSLRLIIIDGCHRLTGSAIEWWFDFHDVTGVSLAFIGNSCFLDKLKRLPDEDQHLSRVGMYHELKLREREAAGFARQILEQIAPGHVEGLLPEAAKIVMGPGHGRTLRKQVSLALDLLEALDGDMALAFKGAGQRLLTGQTLAMVKGGGR